MSASAQPTDVLPVDNFSAGIVAAAAREFPAPVATEDEIAIPRSVSVGRREDDRDVVVATHHRAREQIVLPGTVAHLVHVHVALLITGKGERVDSREESAEEQVVRGGGLAMVGSHGDLPTTGDQLRAAAR